MDNSNNGEIDKLELLGLQAGLVAHVHDQLNDALEKSGVTKETIAKRLGVNKSTVTRMLQEDSNLQLTTLASLSSALGRYVQVAMPELNQTCRFEMSLSNSPYKLTLQGVTFESEELVVEEWEEDQAQSWFQEAIA